MSNERLWEEETSAVRSIKAMLRDMATVSSIYGLLDVRHGKIFGQARPGGA
jgi:hypothetical protein